MPSLELTVSPPDLRTLPADGVLPVVPPLPGLARVLLRRLECLLRAPPTPGAVRAVLDTGAPLAVFPYLIWNHRFRWRAGREYDEVSGPGVGPLRGQVLGHRYGVRLARLRVPIELAAANPAGDRLRLDSLVCQLADPGGPPFVILGLWGGPFAGGWRSTRCPTATSPPGSTGDQGGGPMDKLTRYREIVRRELQGYADWLARPDGQVRYEVVFDPALDHFALVYSGWEGHRRAHGVPFHLDLIDGKVWIQYDGTDRPIAVELVRAGIPKEDIVLTEQPADVRPFTGYGVG